MSSKLVLVVGLWLASASGVARATPPLPDSDGDGYPDSVDCAPNDASIYPGATEIPYDGIDQNCSGADLCDVDLDGFDAIVCGGTDCNDNDPTIYPGAIDIPGDGIDQSCSGEDAEPICDLDGDGYLSLACGGDDCNDADASVHPGAVDIPGDGIDQNCDGTDACVSPGWLQGGACSSVTVPSTPALALLLVFGFVRRRIGGAA
jgi:hypothetical protein